MANDTRSPGGVCCKGILSLAGLFLFLVLWTGCQSINPLKSYGTGGATPEEARIRKLMKWHSGRVEVYREFRTVFTARAVYLSDEVQRGVSDWEIKSRLMTPGERVAFEREFLGGDPPPLKILLGFYTQEEELNDLEEENSAWIPYLKNPDGTITRATCLSLDENNARIYLRFLKWDMSWSKLYLLCFPSSPGPSVSDEGKIVLVISGPQGQGEIPLQFTPPDDQP